MLEADQVSPQLHSDPFSTASKVNNYLLNKVALKNMQKLHLWFARRRKNTTHSLYNKWLIYISSVGSQGPNPAPSGYGAA